MCCQGLVLVFPSKEKMQTSVATQCDVREGTHTFSVQTDSNQEQGSWEIENRQGRRLHASASRFISVDGRYQTGKTTQIRRPISYTRTTQTNESSAPNPVFPPYNDWEIVTLDDTTVKYFMPGEGFVFPKSMCEKKDSEGG